MTSVADKLSSSNLNVDIDYTSSTIRELRAAIKAMIDSKAAQPGGSGLSIGVEVEFFLVNRSGLPVDIATSQEFIRRQSSRKNWRLSDDSAHSELAITSASREKGCGRYTKLKYEYPPHILEVAFAYFNNLYDLHDEVRIVFEDLEETAETLGCKVDFSPFLDHNLTTIIDAQTRKIQELNDSRIIFLQSHQPDYKAEVALFPSFTAGTQIHVGGLNWLTNPNIIHRLYQLESWNPLFGCRLATENIEEAMAILNRRTNLYRDCFPGVSLAAFPKLERWTLDDWMLKLLAAPMGLTSCKEFSGKSFLEIPLNRNARIHEFLNSLRDVQFLRPRFFGTVESRIEPSIRKAEMVTALSAWRLGLALAANSNFQLPEIPFLEVRSEWEHRRTDSNSIKDAMGNSLIELVMRSIKNRGLGEESLLRNVEWL